MISYASPIVQFLIGLPCGPFLTMDYDLDGDRKLQGIKKERRKRRLSEIEFDIELST